MDKQQKAVLETTGAQVEAKQRSVVDIGQKWSTTHASVVETTTSDRISYSQQWEGQHKAVVERR